MERRGWRLAGAVGFGVIIICAAGEGITLCRLGFSAPHDAVFNGAIDAIKKGNPAAPFSTANEVPLAGILVSACPDRIGNIF